MITQSRLSDLLHYDSETGYFVWRKNMSSRVRAGEIAGRKEVNGYWRVKIDGKQYLAHRLAWLYMKGEWPKRTIDHIDRNRSNNSINNLREATYSQNKANSNVPRGSTGLRGVTLDVRSLNKPYRAKICIDGKIILLGHHKTAEEAQAAYLKAARAHFGEFAA